MINWVSIGDIYTIHVYIDATFLWNVEHLTVIVKKLLLNLYATQKEYFDLFINDLQEVDVYVTSNSSLEMFISNSPKIKLYVKNQVNKNV